MADRTPAQAVFCDFDGTITTEDTFVRVLEAFAPEAWAAVCDDLFAFRISLRQSIRQVMATIPCDRLPEMQALVATYPVRSGFVELLDDLEARNIPFYVVSGGLRCLVESVLHPWRSRLAGLYAAEVDLSGPTIQVYSDFESDQELVAKVQVLDKVGASQAIAIGDSITDVNLGMAADLVFARPHLADYLRDRGKQSLPWDSFHDVRQELQRRWSRH